MPEHILTKCELEVMDVVWHRGRVRVQDVVDSLQRPLAYTTVMTTLKILEEKRGVLRRIKEGRAYVYEPLVTRQEVGAAMVGNVTDHVFRGSLKSLVLGLIDTHGVSKSDIVELKQAIAELETDE
jgi:BlaI family penicillinase repressor